MSRIRAEHDHRAEDSTHCRPKRFHHDSMPPKKKKKKKKKKGKNKESARVGVRTKAAERRVADDKLLQAVEGLQNRRPELSQRAVARFLLQRGGGPDDSRLTPEALSKRITRAKKRMTFRK